MAAKVTFFPVGNGDMTLFKTDRDKFVLIDIHVRKAADDPDDETPDVIAQLKERLPRDAHDHPYVHAMMLSHPDKDHCSGLETHFHLEPIDEYPKGSGKIIIREMWSSPIVFRRASKEHTLCPDAKAWAAEARRRVKLFRELGYCAEGDRVLIMGEDVDGKTDDLTAILVKVDQNWTRIDGQEDGSFSAELLAPLPAGDDDDEEETLTKNNSSIISLIQVSNGNVADACRFLTGGDAEVAIWERLWDRHSDNAEQRLGYDLLQAPHHCSWHSLSWDSWSGMGNDAKVSDDARSALGQPRDGAKIVASSKPIKDDEADPPCVRAEREYKDILTGVGGEFVCVGDRKDPLEYEVKPGGLELVKKTETARAAIIGVTAPALIGARPVGHG